MGLRDKLAALLGVSAYEAPPPAAVSLDDERIEQLRKRHGGQLSPLPQTRTRWYLADLESAMYSADAGDLSSAAQLCRAMRRDGVLSGLLGTTSGGLVRLPKSFTGREDITAALNGKGDTRAVFDDMFPASELELLVADGELLGVGVGELRPVKGRSFPVFVRLDPEHLRYRWNENRWYYTSIVGQIPITPGDGRWVLHTRGGHVAPWQHGLWHALGRAWITKEHALLHKANWEAKLANPARAAYTPAGATEPQKAGFLESLIRWGINTVFELPPGWDVKIIESNGRGYESFDGSIAWAEREFMIGLAGQVVTVTGGTGFANADVHKSIRADLIKARADALAYTLNTQGLPQYVVDHFGDDALDESACVEWDTTPPKDVAVEAKALSEIGDAIDKLTKALAPYARKLDIVELAKRFKLPLVNGAATTPTEEEDAPPEALPGLDDSVKDAEVSLQ